jgi:tRNA-binding protein
MESVEQYVARITGYAKDLNPREVLGSTAHRLGSLLAGRDAADLWWKKAPDRWSVAEIVTHLADAEVVAAYRFRMILSTPGTAIQSFDQNKWAAGLRYTTRDPFESLALFRALRDSLLQLVDSLTETELDYDGTHQERGKETLRHLLTLYAGHDLNHIQQVEALLRERDRDSTGQPSKFEPTPLKAEVSGDALDALDVRVGTIRSIRDVPGADRLMVLTVDFGDRERSVVAGIKQERPVPADLVGRQALFVVNLSPRTIRGQLSEAMLFDIGYADQFRPAFAQPEWPVPNGSRAG